MKLKASRRSFSHKAKVGLSAVLFAWSLFMAGFYFSTLLFQDASGLWRRPWMLESINEERAVMPRGQTEDDSFTSIHFQRNTASIIKMAKSDLQPSKLALKKRETAESTKGIRTSYGMFISASEDKTGALGIVEERATLKLFEDITMFQAFNVLRYEVGQKFDSHYDAFHPAQYGPQPSQRVASFLLYLSDVEEGGETMFNFENGSNMDGSYDFQKCIGLKVKLHRGNALLFYSLANGTIDPTSLHGSCPVIRGEKWVATKWIWDQERYYEGDL